MKTKTFLLIISFFLFGCAAPYQIANIGDEFSDPNAPAGRILKGNYIVFKDPLGLIAYSQLNPYLFKNEENNKIIGCGFQLINVRKKDAYLNQKWLVIREGDEMIFLTDSGRIALKAKNTSITHIVGKYNTVTRIHPVDYYDHAWYSCSVNEFRQIASSNSLKIKIIGKEGTEVYGKNRKLLDSFLPNLRTFMNNELQ